MPELETRLREVDVPEPPLGFDPDEVADRAARHVRRRRAGITGALAVASAVAVVAVFAPGTVPVPPAVPPSRPSPPSLADQARIRQALVDVVLRLLPDVRGLRFGESPADAIGPGRMAVTVTFADAAGRPGDFQLTVYGRQAPGDRVPRIGSCSEPGSIGLRCDRIPLPGGAELLVFEVGYPSAGGFTKLRGFNGVLHRADGSTVTLTDAAADAADSVQLSEEQLTKVITDPAFVLPW
ncbi:hypothetical protein AB0L41_19310 [Amycolatopsis mediterranei]|uniref:hypothetical protein n=1 Tax=Amycolatopsis mediterranei TaxID=33910 RepID=UPI0034490258